MREKGARSIHAPFLQEEVQTMPAALSKRPRARTMSTQTKNPKKRSSDQGGTVLLAPGAKVWALKAAEADNDKKTEPTQEYDLKMPPTNLQGSHRCIFLKTAHAV